MFTFTPLLGAQSASSKASQSILELDGGIKILVDVGWDETFDTLELAELEKHIPTLSLILLTHATPSHLGAFVHCCRTFPLFTQIPVYATSPVIALGRTLLQDIYASTPLAATFMPKASLSEQNASTSAAAAAEEVSGLSGSEKTTVGNILLQPPTAEEIARYFSLIHPLKYSQPHQPQASPFSPPLEGLTLTAYNAGHTVGGTIWHIQHGMESIVYAVDWNQARENVVAGAAWFGGSGASGTEVIEQLRKPTALICSSKGGDQSSLAGGRQKRDALLLDMIRSSVAKGGTVLIPTDTSARVLELVYALEHAWRAAQSSDEDALKGAEIYLAGRKAHTTMRLARSMLEWMDEGIIREFEAAEGGDGAQARSDNQAQPAQDKQPGKVGPFTLKHVKIVERKKKLEKILNDGKPKVILASDSSLDWGYSKDALRSVANDPQNLILLTESFPSKHTTSDPKESDKMTLGRMIWQWYEERRDGVATEKAGEETIEQVHSGGRELPVVDVERAPLDSHEQLIYQQYLATQRQLQNTSQGRGETITDAAADALDDAASSTSSEDSESEQQGRVLNFSTSLGHSNQTKLGLRDEDLGVNILLRRKNVFDYDVRGKKGRERMFPYIAPRKRGDEYGEFIRPEEYLRAEEREEDIEQRKPDARGETKLGQKRRWDEVGSGRPSGSGKRQALARGGKDGTQEDLNLPDGMAVDGEEAASSEDEADEPGFEGPAKAVYKRSSITVNARIAHVDFTGLHDKRSLEMLIPLIQPRKLILVGGMAEETASLAAECRNLLAGKDTDRSTAVHIFTPVNGETVDASVDTNAWVVKLSNDLVRRLQWQHVRSLGVVALTAQLTPPPPEEPADAEPGSVTKKIKLDQQQPQQSEEAEAREPETDTTAATTATTTVAKPTDAKAALPVLDVLPANKAAGTRSLSRPLHVGDLRLADLRKLMQAAGHKAEFRGEGTLLIDDIVAVRKSSTGAIEVESMAQAVKSKGRGIEGSFVAVRRRVYEGLAVVGS
ncbi:hypothetical protein VTN49DRAFT_6484 [Thermomyces lanuginosus]|uniref:uncharacterized protein n=1 Tax=Thermomyces lanuginosus TaxID=5541 RepID=UPI00374282D8